jgi:hypothetical protein
MNFDARLFQCVDYVPADFLPHTGNYTIAHLYQQHSRLASQISTFECITQQISHFRREFHAACTCASNCKSQSALRVLRREVWWNTIKCFDHPPAKQIGMSEFSKGNGELFCAFNPGEIGYST